MFAQQAEHQHDAAENRGNGADERKARNGRLAGFLGEVGAADRRDRHWPARAFNCRLRT